MRISNWALSTNRAKRVEIAPNPGIAWGMGVGQKDEPKIDVVFRQADAENLESSLRCKLDMTPDEAEQFANRILESVARLRAHIASK